MWPVVGCTHPVDGHTHMCTWASLTELKGLSVTTKQGGYEVGGTQGVEHKEKLYRGSGGGSDPDTLSECMNISKDQENDFQNPTK